MQSKKTIDKMQENIINVTSNFVETKDTHCNCQDACKLLAVVSNQYKEVVKQNQRLQETVLWQQDQMGKDNEYLIKLEEANILQERDIEVLKRQVIAQKEELEKYKIVIKKVNAPTNAEVKDAR